MVFDPGFLKAKIESQWLGITGKADWLVPARALVVFFSLFKLVPDVVSCGACCCGRAISPGWRARIGKTSDCASGTLSLKQKAATEHLVTVTIM